MEYYGTSLDLAYAYMSYADYLSETNQFNKALKELTEAHQILLDLNKEIGVEVFNYYQAEGNIYRNRTINTQEISRFKTEKKQNLLKSIGSYKKGLTALEIVQNNPEESEIDYQKARSLLDCIVIIKAIGDVYLR
jgi:tetratricopeptide (TPR) repeat protein